MNRDGTAASWVIEARRPGMLAQGREIWKHRHLFAYFARRAVERTYARTILGWLWLFVRPLAPLAISTLVFGGLLKVPSEGVPYFLFFLVGMTGWNLFENSLMWATRSLEINRRLVTKLYFPHLILPLASITPALVDFAIYCGLIFSASVYYFLTEGRLYVGGGGLAWLAAAVSVGMTLLLAVGLGLWTSVLEVQSRDVRFSLRYFMRFWFYVTPVIYPLSFTREPWRSLAMVNPLAPLIEALKWGVLGIGQVHLPALLAAASIIAGLLSSGLWFFNKAEALSIDRL